MKYRVICAFNDLLDSGRLYKLDSVYPREGYTPSEQRITELLGSDNKQGKPLIAVVVESEPKKKRGKRNEND